MFDPEKSEEYFKALAYVHHQLKISAMAFPDNEKVAALAQLTDFALSDEKYRGIQYDSLFKVVNSKRNKEYVEALPEGSLERDFYYES